MCWQVRICGLALAPSSDSLSRIMALSSPVLPVVSSAEQSWSADGGCAVYSKVSKAAGRRSRHRRTAILKAQSASMQISELLECGGGKEATFNLDCGAYGLEASLQRLENKVDSIMLVLSCLTWPGRCAAEAPVAEYGIPGETLQKQCEAARTIQRIWKWKRKKQARDILHTVGGSRGVLQICAKENEAAVAAANRPRWAIVAAQPGATAAAEEEEEVEQEEDEYMHKEGDEKAEAADLSGRAIAVEHPWAAAAALPLPFGLQGFQPNQRWGSWYSRSYREAPRRMAVALDEVRLPDNSVDEGTEKALDKSVNEQTEKAPRDLDWKFLEEQLDSCLAGLQERFADIVLPPDKREEVLDKAAESTMAAIQTSVNSANSGRRNVLLYQHFHRLRILVRSRIANIL